MLGLTTATTTSTSLSRPFPPANQYHQLMIPNNLPFIPHPLQSFNFTCRTRRRRRNLLLVHGQANGDGDENKEGEGEGRPKLKLNMMRWLDLVLDPDPNNVAAVGLTGLLTWASVQVLWQLLLISFAIVVAALKYSFIAALLIFILITLL